MLMRNYRQVSVADTFKRPFSVLLLRLIKKREKILKHYFRLFPANKIIFVLCCLTWQHLEYHGLELQTEHGMQGKSFSFKIFCFSILRYIKYF